jgi:hypothetical protein
MVDPIIFVYNQESGVLRAVRDAWQGNDNCSLARLTHGRFGMRTQWRSFIRHLDRAVEFVNRDDLAARYPKALYNHPKDITHPCVLIRKDKTLSILLPKEAIDACVTLDDLQDAITAALVK